MCKNIKRGDIMKRFQEYQQPPLPEKQYMKVSIKLLSSIKNATMHLLKVVDSYFFDDESADIRPYFYGSLSFGIFIVCNMYFIVY